LPVLEDEDKRLYHKNMKIISPNHLGIEKFHKIPHCARKPYSIQTTITPQVAYRSGIRIGLFL
jgi:hypothetical protein